MKKAGLILIFGVLILLGNLQAQEIHFSLFNSSPLSLNPAFTGAFEGSFRVGGIYRDQYRSVVSNQFSTPMFYVDAPILLVGKKQRDWIGVGAMLFQDQAGIAQLKTNAIQVSAALHHSFDDEYRTVLTFGLQGGPVSRNFNINSTSLNFEDEALSTGGFGGATSIDRNNIADNGNYFDLAAGLMLQSRVNDKTNYRVGLSFGHLLQPEANLASTAYDLSMRIQAHGQLTYQLSNKFQLSPSLYYTTLGPANQFQMQALAGYLLREQIRLNFGLGYRFSDAGELLLGLDYNDIKIALSYDLTLSSLSNANTGGAFEVALGYIFKIYKEPEVKTVILCPYL